MASDTRNPNNNKNPEKPNKPPNKVEVQNSKPRATNTSNTINKEIKNSEKMQALHKKALYK